MKRTTWMVEAATCMLGLSFLTVPLVSRGQYVCATNDGMLTLINYTGTGTVVVIPDKIEELPVTRIGEGAFYGKSLTSVTVPDSVTNIDASAFYSCSYLTNAVIGSNVTAISTSAFEYCSRLQSITLPPRLTVLSYRLFAECSSLTNVAIPGSVTDIRDMAFVYCSGLRDIVVPAGVTNIGVNAFFACSGLASVSLPEGLAGVGAFTFGNCTNLGSCVIPPNVKDIGALFYGCSALTNVVLQEGLETIGNYTFMYCSRLMNVTIPSTVRVIGWKAFLSCGRLEGITIPAGVTYLGLLAFSECTNLTQAVIPASLSTIGEKAFYRCTRLAAFTVDPANLFFSSSDGILFNKSQTTLIQYPATKAGSYAVSNGVSRIASNAFDSCGGLTEVMTGANVATIGAEAFYSCTNLTRVTIGSLTTNIGDNAFGNCPRLVSLFLQGNAPMGYGLVDYLSPVTIYHLPGATGFDSPFGWHPAFGVSTIVRIAVMEMLPPKTIGASSFTARWKWGQGHAPEGELCVSSNEAFTLLVQGYEARYAVNATECLVTNLAAGTEYWLRARPLYSDGFVPPWSSPVKVRTGKGIPVFKNLLSDVPVAKGVSQEFAISNLVVGVGQLKAKSSNTNAVKASLSTGVLKLQYLWKGTNTAKVTLTLTHPTTGYKTSYDAIVSQATGSVFKIGQSALTNAGTRAAQEVTLENRTGGIIHGVRVRALGLDNTTWLINRTGLDPVSKAAIVEIPCVLPPGSQAVVRLVYNKAYKAQAATRPVKYGAWAIMTPVHRANPITSEMPLDRQDLYDGLWLLGVQANRNRLYTVYHSDDDGATWTLNVPMIRSTSNYLMWLDMDEEAPEGRLYRVVDAGI